MVAHTCKVAVRHPDYNRTPIWVVGGLRRTIQPFWLIQSLSDRPWPNPNPNPSPNPNPNRALTLKNLFQHRRNYPDFNAGRPSIIGIPKIFSSYTACTQSLLSRYTQSACAALGVTTASFALDLLRLRILFSPRRSVLSIVQHRIQYFLRVTTE
eukprot:sb/3473291/